ncbi:2-hydroxyacid dehydrogenase [Halomonas ventosae]|uniref:Phosphoglycerate dehydrogenase-like enzyme n=2 Tax=Halomonas TaxID=2745 RepID=A0A4R6H8B2_9GAMM|nr:2-hydroxyacid dehydrogenase [Halomonas ventosae]TDO04643.1 phosphoglycerate dehydrogenase-like enzyme [Halomonas ventosae]
MKICVTFQTTPEQKQFLQQFFENTADIHFLDDHPEEEKKSLISTSEILLSWNPEKEGLYNLQISYRETEFIQLLSAGYDHVNRDKLPSGVMIASNQGAYAAPMAEHAVAMILALSKRLIIYHQELSNGNFNQLSSVTKAIDGSVLGVIGFGSIGKATAKLLKPFGVSVMALNTSGKTEENVEFVGTLNDLDYVLENSDVVFISTPLNKETEGLINRQKLELMKEDAILINVARGPVINEQDLFNHLKTHPDFYAGIDAWWIEPFRYGTFEIHYPFFELPNLLGSPHNSAMVKNVFLMGIEKAAANVARFIRNEPVKGLIPAT